MGSGRCLVRSASFFCWGSHLDRGQVQKAQRRRLVRRRRPRRGLRRRRVAQHIVVCPFGWRQSPMSSARCIQVDVSSVRTMLSCSICKQWLIDAQTTMECIHTFCHSCLIAKFGYDNDGKDEDDMVVGAASKSPKDPVCPSCLTELGADPLKNAFRPDAILQSLSDIVRKTFELRQTEAANERISPVAEEPRSVSPSRAWPQSAEIANGKEELDLDFELALDPSSSNTSLVLERRFFRTSYQLTIQQLRKFLKAKFRIPSVNDINILFRGDVLAQQHSLDFVQKTRSDNVPGCLQLTYSIS